MKADTQPPEAKQRSITQNISIIVGFTLFILGLVSFLNPTFAGLHLATTFHSMIVAIAGATLFYNGHSNHDRNSFLACLCFGLFFLLHALAGFAFGQTEELSLAPELIRLIPNFKELGMVDHMVNGIIGLVLLGGAMAWWRIHHERRRWNRHDRKRERFNKLAHH